MKKHYLSALALSLAVVAPVMANPIGVPIDIYCPNTQGTPRITNFGDYIGGPGLESVLGQNNPVYFRSGAVSSDMPVQLNNYFNDTATYNSVLGRVSCSYISNNSQEPRFSVSYTMTNGKGAVVQSQTGSSVSLLLPIAVKG